MCLNCIPFEKKNRILKNFFQALQTDRWKETIFDKFYDFYVILYIIYFPTYKDTQTLQEKNILLLPIDQCLSHWFGLKICSLSFVK